MNPVKQSNELLRTLKYIIEEKHLVGKSKQKILTAINSIQTISSDLHHINNEVVSLEINQESSTLQSNLEYWVNAPPHSFSKDSIPQLIDLRFGSKQEKIW